jgi:tRNA A37 methylthiotransferase MiaB
VKNSLGVSLSTDIIAGFCDETEEEHLETLSLLSEVKFDQAFMYAYSLRERTHAGIVQIFDSH